MKNSKISQGFLVHEARRTCDAIQCDKWRTLYIVEPLPQTTPLDHSTTDMFVCHPLLSPCSSSLIGFCQVGKGHAYSAARSMTKVGFDFFMGLLNDIAPEAHDKLEAIPHELWARYASRDNVCWDQVTTNPSETANSMLLKVRLFAHVGRTTILG